MKYRIPFNKPHLTGKELPNISEAVSNGQLSGNGTFTKKCQAFFKDKYHFQKCLLTTSCTDALEMTSLLMNLKQGDEVIMPAFTFVSTANAFVLRGVNIKFVDSRKDHPGMDEDTIEALITPKTKAIVVVHYAGVACDMDKILKLVKKHNLFLVEDAAPAFDSYYIFPDGNRKPLGGMGDFGTFSFHETKNIHSGEGGMLVINNPIFSERAEIIWEKGTNRAAFFRGEVEKYKWVDIGSSFLPSELNSAFLYGQIESLNEIQKKRISIFERYMTELRQWAYHNDISLPSVPSYATNNGQMFYILCRDINQRETIINNLGKKGILAVFHYLNLQKSPFFRKNHPPSPLPNCDRYSETLLRLPLYVDLTEEEQDYVIESIKSISL